MPHAHATPLAPGLVARVAAGVRYALTGQTPDWFGPDRALTPVVPIEQQASVAGRQFDYAVGYNLHTQPRHDEPIGFADLRALADSYNVLRLVIETRKDQLARLRWRIRPKAAQAPADERCTQLEAFFASPDREHSWETWLRMLIEDLLVIDAPALYPRRTAGGQLYALEPVDGATIKRILDDTGRTPLPPEPAYQQVLKGLPAIDYSRDELIYLPRNPRTHKAYGYSPVEQIVTTVNIALRRQANQLGYYTEGNVPNLLFHVPKDWQPEQIRQFQAWWDSLTQGQSKHHGRFIPEGADPVETKLPPLKDAYDEWLARVVCFCFAIAPTPFVAQVNRATAETAHAQSLQEGLLPLQNWVKSLINLVIARQFAWPDLEFQWNEDEVTSPLEAAQIAQTYVAAKVLHPDEVRADLGRAPLTAAQKDDMQLGPTDTQAEPSTEA